MSHHSHKHTLSLTTGTSKNVQLYHGIFYLSYRLKCHFGTVSPTLEVSFTLCFFLYDFFFISGLSPSLDSLLLWTFSLFDSSLLCIIHHKPIPSSCMYQLLLSLIPLTILIWTITDHHSSIPLSIFSSPLSNNFIFNDQWQ